MSCLHLWVKICTHSHTQWMRNFWAPTPMGPIAIPRWIHMGRLDVVEKGIVLQVRSMRPASCLSSYTTAFATSILWPSLTPSVHSAAIAPRLVHRPTVKMCCTGFMSTTGNELRECGLWWLFLAGYSHRQCLEASPLCALSS